MDRNFQVSFNICELKMSFIDPSSQDIPMVVSVFQNNEAGLSALHTSRHLH
ncbi:MAG: hypothetical protein DID92_2727745330 [Candidatus Nitrotoga sp. SPKER]|nr:MAG: hypothetical protein DID92_2727745330 [Candidatus Nitrotoga sp. SPKER]